MLIQLENNPINMDIKVGDDTKKVQESNFSRAICVCMFFYWMGRID